MHVAGYVGEPAVQRDRVAPRVAAEQLDGAAVGAQQAEQDPDGGGLAGAVGAEEAVHLARGHGEVEAVQSDGGSERLAEPGDRDAVVRVREVTLISQNSEDSECSEIFRPE